MDGDPPAWAVEHDMFVIADELNLVFLQNHNTMSKILAELMHAAAARAIISDDPLPLG